MSSDRDLLRRLDRIEPSAPAGSLRFLGQVIDGGAMPNAPDKYYLMQPQVIGGTEEENAGGTFASIGDPVPVVFLGTRPLVGERHVAHFAGNRWVAQRTDDTGPIPCGACEIPRRNLTLSWTNSLLGAGSIAMTFNGVNQWTTACFNQLSGRLSCANGSMTFAMSFYTGGNCPNGQAATCQSPGQSPSGLTPAQIECDPVYLRFTLTPGSCPTLASQGYTSFTVSE